MAKLFAPSSWVKRANAPFGVRSGTNADDILIVDSAPAFSGGAPEERISNTMAVTQNQAASWVTLAPNDIPEMYFGYFSILNNNDRRFFRFRVKFGRSFFVANNTIFSGYLKLDMSLGAFAWTEVATIATWPHIPGSGGSSQAGIVVGANPIFLPGSGPAGADADWFLIRCLVSSPIGTPVDIHQWWRSDDFGFSWQFVRNETFFSGTIPFHILRNSTGRTCVGYSGNLAYSDSPDLSTWIGSGGGLSPLLKAQLTAHAGNSMCVYMPGGLTSAPVTGVSCDGGATWANSFGGFDGNNTNIAGLAMGLTESLAFARDAEIGGTGMQIWYSNTGGETWTSQGIDTRISPFQTTASLASFLPNGAPLVIGSNGVVLVSEDRPSGFFGSRTMCPLAFAGVRRAGIPPNCAHPILTRCD